MTADERAVWQRTLSKLYPLEPIPPDLAELARKLVKD